VTVIALMRIRKPESEIPAEVHVGKTVNVKLRGPELKPLDKRLVIHGYECRSLLGKTALSATLLCIDYEGRNRVLKIPVEFYDWKVHGERVGGRRTMYSSFGGEVRVLERVSSLGHPCIVKFEKALEAYGEEPPALVFEFCEGGSLADLLQEQGKLDPVTAVKIIVQVADALAVIHELGYAHGDVKPENILFTRDGIPKLADFNSARAIASTTRSIAPFTPGYAAPEHMKGIPSQKGDVWSLALVLYEAVTGRSLFSSDKNEYEKELKRLEVGGKVEIRTGDSDLDAIIEKCVKVNPDERPSMKALEEMLFAYLEKKIGRREKEIKAEFEGKIRWLKRRERALNLVWVAVALMLGLAAGYAASLPIQAFLNAQIVDLQASLNKQVAELRDLQAKLNPNYVEKIKAKGVLVVGTSADWPPFEYVDKNGNIVGIDVEIAKRIAQELGVKLEVRDMKFAALIEAVKNGQVDIVLADMTPTAERGKQVDFSIPYYFSKGNAVLVPKSKVNDFKGVTDLYGKKIGVQLGTIQEDWAKSALGSNAQVISYDRVYPEMVMAMQRGDIDAMILGSVMANVVSKMSNLAIAFYIEGSSIGAAVALPQSAYDLKYVVNKVVEQLLESGEMQTIFDTEIAKWMESGG
jgi:ABC-type amino acid transport substrate-binding protein/tRNA A-37 threonylcarbamoyl transferase component Bud32